MDEREFSPEEIVKAANLCFDPSNLLRRDVCDECPYKTPYPTCMGRLRADVLSLLNKTFGGGDSDGD